MKYLTKTDLIHINQSVVKHSTSDNFGIQYSEGLDIVSKQPMQFLFGRELYPTIWLKAAFILQKTTKKHIFNNDNKRTALLSTAFFLKINGYELNLPRKESLDFILTVTNNPDDDKIMKFIADWLQVHSQQK